MEEGMAKQETSESGSLPTTSPKAKLVRTCEKSVEEQLQERLRVPRWLRMERCGRAFGFDLDFNSDTPTLIEPEWGDDYDIGLYGRIGLQCHNLQKGTNFKFKRWEKHSSWDAGSMDFYVTLDAVDPDIGSVFSFQTLLRDQGRRSPLGVRLLLCNIVSRFTPPRDKPLKVDYEWDEDTVPDFYKGPLPKWFSDEALERDSKKYYVVPESELHDNDWLQLLMEVAFFSKADRRLDAYLPLELKNVVVETFEDYTTEPSEKLKADNAIFYISYKCCSDPSTPLAGDHRAVVRKTMVGDHLAVVRKTMDGKPEHISLEVSLTRKQEKE
uniref:Uncharacterized protein n=1 Tax=Brassica campestris TaxID=3711 RepID=M4D1G3_BRACM